MTLVISLMVLALFSSVGVTTVYYASADFRESSFSASKAKAATLAEAGMNLARATLFQAPDPRDPSAVPQRTVAMNGGAVVYQGSFATDVWTLTGTASVANPTGAAPITSTAWSQVQITGGSAGSGGAAVWNYLFADSTTSCTTLSDNVTVNVPLYTGGNLCLEDNARVVAEARRVQVGGTVTITENASIGNAGARLERADIAGGCRLNGSALHNPCSAADRIHADAVGAAPEGLEKPPIDLARWYGDAMPGPAHACTTGSFPGGFDNDTALNHSRPAVNLTPSSPYDCRVTDASGQTVGRIAWSGPTSASLIVAGTIFFDGDIRLASGTILYQGKATIYSSGTITMEANARLCGIAGCTSSWNSAANLLILVAGSSTQADGFRIEDNAVFQGGVYTVNDYRALDNASTYGPIIARQLYFKDNARNHYVPFGTILPGAPGGDGAQTVLENVPQSFASS